MDIKKSDYEAAFDYLLDRARGVDREMPTIDGKMPHDLQGYLKIMPRDAELSASHREAVRELFSKEQAGYFMTAWNLFHRVRQCESAKRKRETLTRMAAEARPTA